MTSRSRDWSVVGGAVAAGMAIGLFGSIPKNLLFAANLRFLPRIPWAAPLTVGYLWLLWRFLGGVGASEPTRRERRSSLRANRLPARTWFWALLAGSLAIVALVLGLRVANRMVVLPTQQFFDLTGVSFATVLSFVVVGALAAGVIEEAGFRGYLQGPIERTHGPVVAILITGVMFGLAHVFDITVTTMPYYVAVAAIYGQLAYLTDSILPGLVLHTLGNIWSSSFLWAYGHAEWQTSPRPEPLIWETGPDRLFWTYLAAAVVTGIVMVLAFRQLRTVTRDASARPAESTPRPN